VPSSYSRYAYSQTSGSSRDTSGTSAMLIPETSSRSASHARQNDLGDQVTMTVGDVIQVLKAAVPKMPKQGPLSGANDTLKAGDQEAKVTGIVTTFLAPTS
jgi:hypothetical protein